MRIARGVAARVLSRTDMPLTLAGVDMARDWGHSRDYVRGIWMMLQQNQPRDMVLATGKLRTVHEFAEAAFAHVGIQLRLVSLSFPLTFTVNNASVGAIDRFEQG